MNDEVRILKEEAEWAKMMYGRNLIARKLAEEICAPYIKVFNERSAEIAKKYNQHPKKISFAYFMRQ